MRRKISQRGKEMQIEKRLCGAARETTSEYNRERKGWMAETGIGEGGGGEEEREEHARGHGERRERCGRRDVEGDVEGG